MDKVRLQESINELRKINDETEEILKKAGIDPNDLPTNVQEMIDEYIQITEITGVNNLATTSSIYEWYQINKNEAIDMSSALFELNCDVSKLENEIAAEEAEIREIQNLMNTCDKNIMSIDEFENEISSIKQNIQQLMHKKNGMNRSPNDLDLSELIAAVEEIQLKRQTNK